MNELKMNRRNTLKTLGLLTATATVGMPISSFAQKTNNSVLRIVPQADLKILDPIWTTAAVTVNHGFMIYDTLFGMTAEGKPKPQMVGKVEHSADNLIWTFTLRPHLQFHDNTPVTADDVIASIKRWAARNPVGAQLMEATSEMVAVNKDTFKITLNKPYSVILESLGNDMPPFIMPKRIADTSPMTQINDSTGSGPYIFKKDEYRPGSKIVYIKNPKYVPRDEPADGTSGGKKVYVDRVEWVILPDAQTQINALTAGEVDIIERIPPEQYQFAKGSDQITLTNQMPYASIIMAFNHLQAPFNNPKICRAAMLAVNQEALMRAQFITPEVFHTNPSIYQLSSLYYSTNTGDFTGKPKFAEAKQLLKEAGYDGKPIVLLASTDHPTHNKYPPVLAVLLRQAGFNVDMQSMDWQTLISRRAQKGPTTDGGWSVFATGYSSNVNPLLNPMLSGKGEKAWFGWPTDSKLETLKGQFLATLDENERKTLADQIQLEALNNGVITPLGDYKPLLAHRKNVSGIVHAITNVYWGIKKA